MLRLSPLPLTSSLWPVVENPSRPRQPTNIMTAYQVLRNIAERQAC